jgi:micrococcal nuclease
MTVIALLTACGGSSGPVVRAPTAQQAFADATVAPVAPSVISPPLGLVQARVLRVVDGDTIEVERILDGRATLRLIGVDTPETVAPGQPVGCFGPEASANTKQLLEGRTVLLEKDVSETDRFQRLLRYVYLDDGRMVNEVIVRDGYAQVATFPPDVKYQQRFLIAQTEARNANRGLWGKCAGAAPLMPASTPSYQQPPVQAPVTPRASLQPPVPAFNEATPSPSQQQAANCSGAYPTVCIPPAPPDLDCKDIPFKRFTVLPPDPHKFDADGDGIGCDT